MRLESRLYRTVQAERAVRGEHEQYGCPDAHENAHASDLHDMEPKLHSAPFAAVSCLRRPVVHTLYVRIPENLKTLNPKTNRMPEAAQASLNFSAGDSNLQLGLLSYGTR